MSALKKINQKQAVSAIANLESFEASALRAFRALTVRDGYLSGRLYGDDLERFRAVCANVDNIDDMPYIVFSYGTPIAWYHGGEWNLATAKFSVTTSKHQSIVRRATGFIVGKGVAA